MGLFGYNNASGEMKPFSRSHMRVYSCKISDADGLVRDFVPCRELAGEKRAGLFDGVNRVFYPNAFGSDDFLIESGVPTIDPISAASEAATYEGGDPLQMSAEVNGATGPADGTAYSCTLDVTVPSAGYTALWYDG